MVEINDEIIDRLREDPEVSRTVLLSDFALFIKVFHFYMTRKQFKFLDFHYTIIEELERYAFLENEETNLYIGMAPRYGKTSIMGYFVGWGYAINPQGNFIATSYGDDLIKKFSTTIRNIVTSELFRTIFGIRLTTDSTAKELWKLGDGGEFRASSLKGVITGFGAGIAEDKVFGGALLIDDYLKASDYGSQAKKDEVYDIFENTLKSRKNNPKTPIIVIAQRLAKDDLIGRIKQSQEDIIKAGGKIPVEDTWKFLEIKTYDEVKEETIWKEKHSPEYMERLREINPFLFYSQYQQNPIVMGGAVIKTQWFKYYPLDKPIKYKKLFITGDTAQKVKEHNDYSVFCLWGICSADDTLHLIDMIRGKWESPELKSNFVRFWRKWKVSKLGTCTAVYIEDKSSGTGLIQDLKKGRDEKESWGAVPVIGWLTERDKLVRVDDSLTYIAEGYVMLPCSKEYGSNPDFLSECESFTRDDSHTNDDMVDNLSMAVDIALARRSTSTLDVL